jgi:predicted glutamine amidotransferase
LNIQTDRSSIELDFCSDGLDLKPMCRFALYLGEPITINSLVTEPVHSIIHQSFQSKEQERPLNGDGFGLAWYVPEIGDEPAVFKDITPAWNDSNLINLARVTKSSCILAHVRAATPGYPVIQLNCHPFVSGSYAFMHNGRAEGFKQFRREILAGLSDQAFDLIKGSTDSEHLFAVFMDQIWKSDPDLSPEKRMIQSLEYTIQRVEELRMQIGESKPSFLNLAVSDGKSAVVTRFVSPGNLLPNSLYYSTGGYFECTDGICRMKSDGDSVHATIVASEPLSEENCWLSIDPNHLIVIDSDLNIDLSPIG